MALLAAGCQTASAVDHARSSHQTALDAAPRATPFTVVSDGNVSSLVPHHWSTAPLDLEDGSLREGLMASPNLDRWRPMDGTEPGMEAAWMDVSRVGVPSDFFYMAAKWPALPKLVTSHRCTAAQEKIIVDHRPVMRADGEVLGDFAATASGTCRVGHRVNRWSYFVAAPSYGPVRRVGLPASGLYLVVAVVNDSPRAEHDLHRMVYGARFGRSSVNDLMVAAQRSARLNR